jgi:hypothetical protein
MVHERIDHKINVNQQQQQKKKKKWYDFQCDVWKQASHSG